MAEDSLHELHRRLFGIEQGEPWVKHGVLTCGIDLCLQSGIVLSRRHPVLIGEMRVDVAVLVAPTLHTPDPVVALLDRLGKIERPDLILAAVRSVVGVILDEDVLPVVSVGLSEELLVAIGR